MPRISRFTALPVAKNSSAHIRLIIQMALRRACRWRIDIEGGLVADGGN
jgi:hypothetical protein